MSDRANEPDRDTESRIHALREATARAAHAEQEAAEARARLRAGRRKQHHPDHAAAGRIGDQQLTMSILERWEAQHRTPVRTWLREAWRRSRNRFLLGGGLLAAFLLGLQVAASLGGGLLSGELADRVRRMEARVNAREGELELVRLELARLRNIMEYSARYDIPSDLATAIHDIALTEGIDPALAFRLVQVESGFTRRAVSPVGAVGYTQLMPATAFGLEPGLTYEDLFERDTNLRLGFRYLRLMLERYGDLRLALLAYNRGPGRVDGIRREGGDPGNGYARSIIGGQ